MSQRFRRRKRAPHLIPPPAWIEAPVVLAQAPEETTITGNIDQFMQYLNLGAFAAEWDRAAARAQATIDKWEAGW